MWEARSRSRHVHDARTTVPGRSESTGATGRRNKRSTSTPRSITSTHVTCAAGVNTVRVTVTDNFGAAGSGTTTVTATSQVVTLVGAGNIARCGGDRATTRRPRRISDNIPAPCRSGRRRLPRTARSPLPELLRSELVGRHKVRTYPVTGNHESTRVPPRRLCQLLGHQLFGRSAGDPSQVITATTSARGTSSWLNSNNAFVSTAVGSPQERAPVRSRGRPRAVVLAMWHRPTVLLDHLEHVLPNRQCKAVLGRSVCCGRRADHQRAHAGLRAVRGQTPTGAADPTNGIREIIVGTRWEWARRAQHPDLPNSEVQIGGVYGVLKLHARDGPIRAVHPRRGPDGGGFGER